MGAETVAFHNIPGGDGNGGGGNPDPLKPNTYTPNDVFQEYKTAGNLEFPDLLNSTLQNNKKSKATLLSALDNMVQNGNVNAKKAKEVVKGLSELSEKYPEYADIIRRSTAGQYNSAIGRIGQAMLNVGSHINNLVNTGTARSEEVIKKGQKLVDQYKELARTGIFDSKFENEFEAATNTAPLTRKLPINSVNLESDKVRTAITKLSNDLNINKFEILEGEWPNQEDKKITITGVSREPYGAGSGIAFELMDSKGNTVIATPHKQAAQGIIGELDKVLPGIKSANNYRDMIPLSYAGQQKDFADIGDEINNPQLTKQFKGYKLVLNEDGTYTRISPKGEKVNATNPTLLLPQM
jgi:polyhydroxyalkanoate synthesis regulator phasin